MVYRGKVIAITGGNGEIALGTARHMLQCGASKIAMLDVNYYEEEMTKLYEDFPAQEVFFHLTDVTKKRDIESGLREILFRFGGIDILLTCAGILDEQNVDEMIDINLVGGPDRLFLAIKLMIIAERLAGSDSHQLYRHGPDEPRERGQRRPHRERIVGGWHRLLAIQHAGLQRDQTRRRCIRPKHGCKSIAANRMIAERMTKCFSLY